MIYRGYLIDRSYLIDRGCLIDRNYLIDRGYLIDRSYLYGAVFFVNWPASLGKVSIKNPLKMTVLSLESAYVMTPFTTLNYKTQQQAYNPTGNCR